MCETNYVLEIRSPRRVLLGIFGGGVISEQKVEFYAPVFRPDL